MNKKTDTQATFERAQELYASVWHDTPEQRQQLEREVAKRGRSVKIRNTTVPASYVEEQEQPKRQAVTRSSDSDVTYTTDEDLWTLLDDGTRTEEEIAQEISDYRQSEFEDESDIEPGRTLTATNPYVEAALRASATATEV
jgi:hypothetical protein